MSYRVIRDGVEIGVSPTIVHIFLGDNGAYQECPPDEAHGFCVMLPVKVFPNDEQDDINITSSGKAIYDTVFSLPGKNLAGAVGEATYEVITPEQYEEITGESY